MSPARYSMLLMIAFGALWAAVEAVATHLSRGYSPFQVVWTRYGVHLAFMLCIWGWREPRSLVATRRPAFQLARSALMLIMPASFIFGVSRGLNAGTLMAIFWVSPLLILAFAAVFLRERVAPSIWLAGAGAAVGAALLMAPGQPPSVRALFWPLSMAASFSLYVVMTRSLRTESTRANLFYTALGVFIALSPLMPSVWVTPTRHDFMIMVAIGLIGCASLYCLDRLAAAAPVSDAATLTSAQVVIASLLGALSGHFHPSPEV